MKRIYIIFLILLPLLFACKEEASENFRQPRRPPQRGRMGPPRAVFGDLNRMKRDLNLTDSQISQIEKINDSFAVRHEKIRERIEPFTVELRTLLKEDTIDYDKVRVVLMKMAEVDVDRQIYMIQQRLSIEKILTEEQRNKIHKRRD